MEVFWRFFSLLHTVIAAIFYMKLMFQDTFGTASGFSSVPSS